MASPVSSKIRVIVGSTNPTKVHAAKKGILFLHPSSRLTVIPYKANPGIEDWKSKAAIGQPFGARQTAFGAIKRLEDCWQQFQKSKDELFTKTYAIAFENGLLKPVEVGEKGQHWFDICFVAIRDSDPESSIIIKRGKFVKTEFAPPENSDEETFDKAVVAYEKLIMPSLIKKEDLYLGWTTNHPSGLKTREDFLVDCKLMAVREQAQLKIAKDIVDHCVKSGMTASAGPRYQNMLWTRDLAYMAPIYLQRKHHIAFLDALRTIHKTQCQNHLPYKNGYQTFDRFGNIPIVCIPDNNKLKFLRERIRGTKEEPGWQIKLWNFSASKNPKFLDHFPIPPHLAIKASRIEDITLNHLSAKELQNYYYALLVFQNKLQKELGEKAKVPEASFSLQRFMAGTLEDLTPGTRDSEIHYIRAIFSLIKHSPENTKDLLKEFSSSMAKAFFYLYVNVIDPEDGLPRGADSRDIFADILYDSKVLTNAVFLYEALSYLQEHAKLLEETSFLTTLLDTLVDYEPLRKHLGKRPPNNLLVMIKEKNLSKSFQKELEKLKHSIQTKLLFQQENFKPRDFLPGKRAEVALDEPVFPTPVAPIIKKDHPTFIQGTTCDPQSLAHAILLGLVPKNAYEDCLEHFKKTDSNIGIEVFVPISGKNDRETSLLQKVKGNVVWPHVAWTIVRALIAMDMESALNFAEVQRDKLMQLEGCGEWYAIDPETKKPIQGGDPYQGWAATCKMMAIDAIYLYYAANSKK